MIAPTENAPDNRRPDPRQLRLEFATPIPLALSPGFLRVLLDVLQFLRDLLQLRRDLLPERLVLRDRLIDRPRHLGRFRRGQFGGAADRFDRIRRNGGLPLDLGAGQARGQFRQIGRGILDALFERRHRDRRALDRGLELGEIGGKFCGQRHAGLLSLGRRRPFLEQFERGADTDAPADLSITSGAHPRRERHTQDGAIVVSVAAFFSSAAAES